VKMKDDRGRQTPPYIAAWPGKLRHWTQGVVYHAWHINVAHRQAVAAAPRKQLRRRALLPARRRLRRGAAARRGQKSDHSAFSWTATRARRETTSENGGA